MFTRLEDKSEPGRSPCSIFVLQHGQNRSFGPTGPNTPAKLCIHFDGAALPLPRVREMVRAAGADISGRYGHATWQVEGIGHERRARTVGETLCQVPGVLQADASASGVVGIDVLVSANRSGPR